MANRVYWLGSLMVMLGSVFGSRPAGEPRQAARAAGDASFQRLTQEILDDHFKRNPTTATDLGVHEYDDQLEDYSAAAVEVDVRMSRAFRARVAAVDPSTLSPANRLDREWLVHVFDSALLEDTVVKPWAKDPDTYSSGITDAAYVMIKRSFAPPEVRLRRLIARLNAMPGALAEARRNLDNPPRVYTEIAIDQIDGDQDLFKTAIVEAFADVKDQALQADFARANARVLAALGDYKTWLETDLLKRSQGTFAYGADTYRARLLADEMIDTPLADLLQMAERDLAKNQAAFAATAHLIDPTKGPVEVLAALQHDHPPEDRLLQTTQATLDALAAFIADHHIVTVPNAARAVVKETPPFMRATTSAAMDIPGPFEAVATEAYYYMTLPDPTWPAAERDEFMGQWYYPAISNVSVHEVWPGHYLQFLYGKQLTSNVRKVFTANSNTEGWAHYVEQMMMDQGFHADDPRYRLAQLQDALLRDVRFIVGIRMHTQGMTVEEAQAMFEKSAYQPTPVARSEARRGTSDATYGYYTMGKLMILKLRDDYRAKVGAAYTLEGFHNAFIKVGGLPLPLVRDALLGARGQIF